jgi:hypothetical protein
VKYQIIFPAGKKVKIWSRTPLDAILFLEVNLIPNDYYFFTENYKIPTQIPVLYYGRLIEISPTHTKFDDLTVMSEDNHSPVFRKSYKGQIGIKNNMIHRVFKIPDTTRRNYISLMEGLQDEDDIERKGAYLYLGSDPMKKGVSEFLSIYKTPNDFRGGKRRTTKHRTSKRRTRKSKNI